VIRLGGLHLGLTEVEIDRKVAAIEETTLTVLHESNHAVSTAEAAVAFARRKLDAARNAKTAAVVGAAR
jgi:hypothetical protein